MKKIFSIVLILLFLISAGIAFAGQANTFNNQTGLRPSSMTTLMTGSTGTTAATNSNYAIFDYPYDQVACDFITSPTVSTGAISFALYSNVTGTNLFDLTNALVSTVTVTPSLTLSVLRSVHPTAGSVVRSLMAIVTSPTTTAVVTINCGAVQ